MHLNLHADKTFGIWCVDVVRKEKEETSVTKCQKKSYTEFVKKQVPLVKYLQEYSVRDGIGDLVAGTTIAMLILPQAIGYALLAGLRPQIGLNSCIMGFFVYFILGTIREIHVGPASLLAIVTSEYTRTLNTDHVVLLTLLCGSVQIFIGIFRLGFLAEFISTPAFSGFSSAASLIIIITQLRSAFGVQFSAVNVLDHIRKLVQHYTEFKFADTIACVSSIIIIIVLKKVEDIPAYINKDNTKFAKVCWFISVSKNAILVFIFCCITYYFESEYGKAPYQLSGDIDKGIPDFTMAPFSTQLGNSTVHFTEMVHNLKAGVFVVPIVSILINISIGKKFAGGKKVRVNHEVITQGLCNIASSFVSSMPTSGAFTRSGVSSGSGVRTPVSNLFAGLVVLLSLYFLSPFFRYIPQPTIAAILICACSVLIEVSLVPLFWRTNKIDLITLVLTFTLSLGFGVEKGLFAGVLCDVCHLMYLWARPTIQIEIFDETNINRPCIKITPKMGYFFPGVSHIYRSVHETAQTKGHGSWPVVFNCENFKNADYTAIMSLAQLLKDFQKRRQELIFINANKNIRKYCEVLKMDLNCFQDEDTVNETYLGIKGHLINEPELGRVLDKNKNRGQGLRQEEDASLLLNKHSQS